MGRLRQLCKKHNVESPARIIGRPQEGTFGDIEIFQEHHHPPLEKTKPADVEDRSTSSRIVDIVLRIEDVPDRIFWLEEAQRYCQEIEKQLSPDWDMLQKQANKFGPFKKPSHAPQGFSQAVKCIDEQLQRCKTKALEALRYKFDDATKTLGIDKRALSNREEYFEYAYELYYQKKGTWDKVYEIIEAEREKANRGRRYKNVENFKTGKNRYIKKKRQARK